MGFFGGLEGDKYDRKYSDTYLAQRIWDYAKQFGRYVTMIVTAVVILSVVVSLRPILISAGIDALESDQNVLMLILIGLFFALKFIRKIRFQLVFYFFFTWFSVSTELIYERPISSKWS